MAAATMYVTPAGAGTKAGNDWANAMGLAEFETDVEGSAEAGDIYYVAGGTYTFTGHMSSTLDGTSASPISIIGVASGTSNEPPVYSDWATGDSRPLFACGIYQFVVDDYWNIFNIRATGSNGTSLLKGDVGVVFFNCKSQCTGNGGAVVLNGIGASAVSCECVGALIALDCSTNTRAFACYVHDSPTGIRAIASDVNLYDCIVESCTTGVDMQYAATGDILNCTIDWNTTGIHAFTAYLLLIANNIISNNTTGASWDSVRDNNYWDYNNFYNNGTDRTNVTAGNNDIDVDPQFTDAANGDFSIGTNLKAAGFPGAFPGGLSTGYLDIGAVQREEAGGGGWGFRRRPRTVGA